MSKGYSLRGHAVRKSNGAWTDFGIVWATALSNVAYYGETLITTKTVDDWAGTGANGKAIGKDRALSILNNKLWTCGAFGREVRVDGKSANGKSTWAVRGADFETDYRSAAERGLLTLPPAIAAGRLSAAYREGRDAGLQGNLLQVFVTMRARADLFGNYWGSIEETTEMVNRRHEVNHETGEKIEAKPMSRSAVHRTVQQLVASGIWAPTGAKGLHFEVHNLTTWTHNDAVNGTVATPSEAMEGPSGTIATPYWDDCDPLVGRMRPPTGTVATPRPAPIANTGDIDAKTVVDHLSSLTSQKEATEQVAMPLKQATGAQGQDEPLDQDQSSDESLGLDLNLVTPLEFAMDYDAEASWSADDYAPFMLEFHRKAMPTKPWGFGNERAVLASNAQEWIDGSASYAPVDPRDLIMSAGYHMGLALKSAKSDAAMKALHGRIRDTARSESGMRLVYAAMADIERKQQAEEAEHEREQREADRVAEKKTRAAASVFRETKVQEIFAEVMGPETSYESFARSLYLLELGGSFKEATATADEDQTRRWFAEVYKPALEAENATVTRRRRSADHREAAAA